MEEEDMKRKTRKVVNELIDHFSQQANRSEISQTLTHMQLFMSEIHAWADLTFGAKRKPEAVVHHLKKECDELIESLKKPEDHFHIREELADCFILILNVTSKAGYDFPTLLRDAKAKMDINKARKWGKPDKNGVVEHIKSPAK